MATQINPRVAANKAKGRLGGLATAAKYGQEFKNERAAAGGNAVKARYGPDYFRHINLLRKTRRGGRAVSSRKRLEAQLLAGMNVGVLQGA